MPEELWIEAHNIVQEAATKPSQRKGHSRKQSGCPMSLTNRREGKQNVREIGKVTEMECGLPKNSKERQEGLLK